MKSEIKKIIILKEGEKQTGIIVVRDDSIKKYGTEYDKEQLFDIYNKLYSELKTQYKSELIGLTETQIANKFNKLKVIEYSDDKLIANITSNLDENNKVNEYSILYLNGDVDEKKVSDFFDLEQIDVEYHMSLLNLCHMYGIKVDTVDDINEDIINKLKKLKLLKENKNKKDSRGESASKGKIKNFVMNHKVISSVLLAGTIILVTTIPGCVKKNSNNKNQNSNVISFPEITNMPDPTATPEPLPTATPIIVNEIPTLEPVEYFKEIYINGEEKLLPDAIEPTSNDLIVQEVYGQKYYMRGNSFDYTFDNLNLIRNENMSNIGNYVQSGIAIPDSGKYIYYENKFTNGDIRDKAYVKYFSMIGNSMIKSVYVDNNFSDLLRYSKLAGFEAVRLIRDDDALCVYINGEQQWISFSELSYNAQIAVLNIAWANNLPLNKNIISYNSGTYNQDNISDIILDKYDSLSKTK